MGKYRGYEKRIITAMCSTLLAGAIAVVFLEGVWGETKAITPGLTAPQPNPGWQIEGPADFAGKLMPRNIPGIRKRSEYPVHSGNSMPVLTPDPTIDYKILVTRPNPDIDYKILVIRPGWNMDGNTITLPPKANIPTIVIPKPAPER